MLVTPSGIITEVKLVQPQNASFPMLVTLEGILTDVNPLQPLNAELPMLVTLDGITTHPFIPHMTELPFFDKSNPLTELYLELSGCTENSTSPLQPPNALSPMLVTLDGIVTDISPLQPLKADLPMLVTLGGIVTDVRPLHPE